MKKETENKLGETYSKQKEIGKAQKHLPNFLIAGDSVNLNDTFQDFLGFYCKICAPADCDFIKNLYVSIWSF